MGLVVYPNDASIAQCATHAAQLIKKTRPRVSFTAKQRNSRRGKFGQLNVGVAHGGRRLVSVLMLAVNHLTYNSKETQ